jgi:hypothetical protein
MGPTNGRTTGRLLLIGIVVAAGLVAVHGSVAAATPMGARFSASDEPEPVFSGPAEPFVAPVSGNRGTVIAVVVPCVGLATAALVKGDVSLDTDAGTTPDGLDSVVLSLTVPDDAQAGDARVTTTCAPFGAAGYGYDGYGYGGYGYGGAFDLADVSFLIDADVPGPPRSVEVDLNDADALVHFDPPESDGGADIVGYTATCSPVGGGDDRVASDTDAPITVTGLVPGVEYQCRVFATNAAGDGPAADADGTVVSTLVPGAPVLVGVTAGDAEVIVAFGAPVDDGGSAVTGYTASCAPVGGGAVGSATGAASPLIVSSLVNGTAYTCTVLATNAVGDSPASDTSSPVTPLTIPGAPTSADATRGNAQASVVFSAPVDDGGSAVTGYTASCAPVGGGAAGSGTGVASPLTVSSLVNGTAYTCTVVATNAAGDGPSSDPSNAITPAAAPGAPVLVGVTAGDAEVIVAFSAPVDDGGSAVTGYTASCAPVGGGAAGSATGSGSLLTVSGLVNGTAYTCTVLATNAVGDSPASDTSSPATPLTTPGAPTGVHATRGDAQASVAFSAPVDDGGSAVTGYTATCGPVGGGTAKSASGAGSPLTVAGLVNGTAYTCTVVATNAAGDGPSSDPSNAITPAAAPGAPVLVGVTAGDAKAIVAFDAPGSDGGSAVTGYTATCSPVGGGTAKSATGSGSPLTVSGLVNGTAYTCTVLATNAVGDGPPSDTSSPATPFVPAVPGAPLNVVASPGVRNVAVTFAAPSTDGGSPILSYTATCAPVGSGATRSSSGPASPLVVGSLSAGIRYRCRVRATNAVGNGPFSANSAAVKPFNLPGAPRKVTAARAAGRAVKVTWAAPKSNGGSPITSYTATCTAARGATGTATRSGAGGGKVTVTGLTGRTRYTCRVRARNAGGLGPSSSGASVRVGP